ncbi:MAG: methionine--tRNA ligase [Chloroflexi bacterium]|nr:methionine--tRNA ligase [Chloroflexota bacterium]
MIERIFIGVAWPYANGSLHLGHLAGAYLPADIFARYHRMKGNTVLMVSGSDQHGTPITVRAEQEGHSPQEVVARFHQEFLGCWQRMGITFNLFTTTGTPNHARAVHDMFLRLKEKGYIYQGTMPLPYCPSCRRFLPDRYVEGTCPHCASPDARGDQCDKCGKTLNPADLLSPRCKLCGSQPIMRDSEHLFFRLSAFAKPLAEWVGRQSHWRSNVLNFTRRYIEEGLKDRAITRDLAWGVPVPLSGFEDKRIYVWFEAVIGYLSASQEWAQGQGQKDAWLPFWQEGVKSYYFIGKDNIPFHTLIWPAMLLGYGVLPLPYDVPANEFLTFEGQKFSTSRNWAVWLPDYLERYAPDPLRYYLSINMPETSDTDFSWREFYRRNNDELVATYGNLVHRVLTFTQRQFNGQVPHPGEADTSSQALLQRAQSTLDEVDRLLSRCRFREAIRAAMALAGESNRYLEEKSPWKNIKQDPEMAATAMHTALGVIAGLKTMLYPFLPFSSEKLHLMLGFPGAGDRWEWQVPQAGQRLPAPQPLFVKLEESDLEAEVARLGQPR